MPSPNDKKINQSNLPAKSSEIPIKMIVDDIITKIFSIVVVLLFGE